MGGKSKIIKDVMPEQVIAEMEKDYPFKVSKVLQEAYTHPQLAKEHIGLKLYDGREFVTTVLYSVVNRRVIGKRITLEITFDDPELQPNGYYLNRIVGTRVYDVNVMYDLNHDIFKIGGGSGGGTKFKHDWEENLNPNFNKSEELENDE